VKPALEGKASSFVINALRLSLCYCLILTSVLSFLPKNAFAPDDAAGVIESAPPHPMITNVDQVDVWGITKWEHVSADGTQRRGLHEPRESYFRKLGPQDNDEFKSNLEFRVDSDTGFLRVVNTNHYADPGCFDQLKIAASVVLEDADYLYLIPKENPAHVAIERPNFPNDQIAGYWKLKKSDFMKTFENDPPLAIWHYDNLSENVGLSEAKVSELQILAAEQTERVVKQEGDIREGALTKGEVEAQKIKGEIEPSRDLGVLTLTPRVLGTLDHEVKMGRMETAGFPGSLFDKSAQFENSVIETSNILRYLTLSMLMSAELHPQKGFVVAQERIRKISQQLEVLSDPKQQGKLSPKLHTEIAFIRQQMMGLFLGTDKAAEASNNAAFKNYTITHNSDPLRDRGMFNQQHMDALGNYERALGGLVEEVKKGSSAPINASMYDLLYSKDSMANTKDISVALSTKALGYLGVLGAITTGAVFAVVQTMHFYKNYDDIVKYSVNWKVASAFVLLIIFLVGIHVSLKYFAKKVTGKDSGKAAIIEMYSKMFNSLGDTWEKIIKYRLFFGLSARQVDRIRKGLPLKVIPQGETLTETIKELKKKKSDSRMVRGVEWTDSDAENLRRCEEMRDKAFDVTVQGRRMSAQMLNQLAFWLRNKGHEVNPDELVGIMGALIANNDPTTKMNARDMQLALTAASEVAAHQLDHYQGDASAVVEVSAENADRFKQALALSRQMRELPSRLGLGVMSVLEKPVTRGSQEPNEFQYRQIKNAVVFDAIFSFIPEVIARAANHPDNANALFSEATGIPLDMVSEVIFQVYFMFLNKSGWMMVKYDSSIRDKVPEFQNPKISYRNRLGIVLKDNLLDWEGYWKRIVRVYVSLFWVRLTFRVSLAFVASGFDYMSGVLGVKLGSGFAMPSVSYMVWYLFICGPMLTFLNYSTVVLALQADVPHANKKYQDIKEKGVGALVGIITGWWYWLVKAPFFDPNINEFSLTYGIKQGWSVFAIQPTSAQMLEIGVVALFSGMIAGYQLRKHKQQLRQCSLK
jgi:hypothetical protein